MNKIITSPMGVNIIDDKRIHGELVRCEVIMGTGGQKATASNGLAFANSW